MRRERPVQREATLMEIPSKSARPTPELTWHEEAKGRLTVGDRAADRLRQAMGSWRFVGLFFAVMAAWWALNTLGATAWDPYPFILLNLFLSMLAGVQGAILLIAAKRQDSISAALAQHELQHESRGQGRHRGSAPDKPSPVGDDHGAAPARRADRPAAGFRG